MARRQILFIKDNNTHQQAIELTSPSFYHLVRREGQGLSSLVAAVKFRAVNQTAGVMAVRGLTDGGCLADARADLYD